MNYQILAGFLVGMLILAATPGPGVFASMAKAITEGFHAALYFIGGLVLGDMIFLLLAIFGLTAVANILGGFFLVVRIAGGLYLIFLGLRTLRDRQVHHSIRMRDEKTSARAFTGGFLVTLGNPKPILFYASILPTIINFNELRSFDILMMLALIAFVSFGVLGTYSYIASLSHKMNLSRGWQKRMNQVSGLIMILVGLFIMFK